MSESFKISCNLFLQYVHIFLTNVHQSVHLFWKLCGKKHNFCLIYELFAGSCLIYIEDLNSMFNEFLL